jgi:hypothetical protein
MARWNLKSASLCILFCMFFLMLLVVVLPDVDLPDTAFHRGTAPIVVHAKATSAPPAPVVVSPIVFTFTTESDHLFREESAVAHFAAPNFLPIFFRSIRR